MLIHLVGGPQRWAGRAHDYDIDEDEALTFSGPDAVYLATKPRQTMATVDGEAVIFVYVGVSLPEMSMDVDLTIPIQSTTQ